MPNNLELQKMIIMIKLSEMETRLLLITTE